MKELSGPEEEGWGPRDRGKAARVVAAGGGADDDDGDSQQWLVRFSD
jgi:hypothetical protein